MVAGARRWAVAALLVNMAAMAATGTAQAQDAAGADAARAAHKRGTAAYQLGNFDEAIAAFREAYALSPTAGLLFNLAQAYRAKGPSGCADALRTYRAYLREAPDAPNRALTDGHIADMERCVEANAPPPPASPPQPVPAPAPGPRATQPPPDTPIPWVHIAVGGVGVAAAVVGAVLLGSAGSEYDRLEEQCPAGDCPPESWQSYQTQERVGVGLVIGGAALAVGAAVVWLVVPDSRARPPTAARPGAATVLRF